MKLAREVSAIFYGDTPADLAQEGFIRTFQQKETPDEMDEYQLASGETVMDVLLNSKLVESKTKARSLLEQKGVRLDGETLENANEVFPHAGVLQVGKRKFLRVK